VALVVESEASTAAPVLENGAGAPVDLVEDDGAAGAGETETEE
jgi:hypothetical protein